MRDFPKAKLFSLRVALPSLYRRWWEPLYVRVANASILYWGPLEVSWRRSYLPHVAYSYGWDAGYMTRYGESRRSIGR